MRTVTRENGTPTPVLVTGVERRCSLATNPNVAESRPRGLYGNQFAMTPEDAVRRAITPLEPPTISNIIAIAAPRGGWGRYAADEIEHILVTAYSGFRAAVEDLKRLGGGPVVIYTGWWGCGAFGGNRDLMAILQVLAARLVGVNRLAFHTGDDEGEADLERALDALRTLEFAVDASTSHELIQKSWSQGIAGVSATAPDLRDSVVPDP